MVDILAILYLAVPGVLFALGWLRPVAAAVVALPLAVGTAGFIREAIAERKHLPTAGRRDKRRLLWMLVLVTAWVLFAGVGGFIWQNPWDHKFRNAVFMDLVNRPWPVEQDGLGLCYYLGYWIPSALVGKAFGLETGYAFQVFWAVLGISLAGLLIFRWLGKISWKAFGILVFFSGLDVAVFGLFTLQTAPNPLYSFCGNLFRGVHMELLTGYFNSSANTTLLFWLYNQIIPFWVGMMLLLTRRNNRSAVLVFGLMLFYCPFPCVALVPVMVYWMLLEGERRITLPGLWRRFRQAFTLCNLSVVPFALTIALYYASNIARGRLGLLPLNGAVLGRFALFFLCEYGVYLLFVYRDNRRNPLLYLLGAVTAACSFVVMGDSYDFAWRTCVPFAFYLMLLVMKQVEETDWHRPRGVLLALVLLLGAVTPATEMVRTLHGELAVLRGQESARSDALPTAFQQEENECYVNFIGDGDSLFFRYLAAEDRTESIQ